MRARDDFSFEGVSSSTGEGGGILGFFAHVFERGGWGVFEGFAAGFGVVVLIDRAARGDGAAFSFWGSGACLSGGSRWYGVLSWCRKGVVRRVARIKVRGIAI